MGNRIPDGSKARSISQGGTTEPFDLHVVRGVVANHTAVNQIWEAYCIPPGMVRGLSPSGQINPPIGTYVAGTSLKFVSNSAEDDSTGTGAQVITIYGLTSTGAAVTAIATLDGLTPVTAASMTTFVSISYMDVTTPTGGKNVGTITITNNDSTDFDSMLPGAGTTSRVRLDVPLGKFYYLTELETTTSSAPLGFGQLNLKLWVKRKNTGDAEVCESWTLTSGATHNKLIKYPHGFDETDYVYVTVENGAGGSESASVVVSASFLCLDKERC